MAQMALEFEAEQRRIPGFGGTKFVSHYTVDALGVVRSHRHSGIVRVLRQCLENHGQCLGNHGRLQANLCNETGKHTVMVHRIVALSFLGPCPSGMEVSHLNGDHLDNRLDNLKYETSKQNHARKEEHGTLLRGETHGSARLTAKQALQIYALAWAGELTQPEIAERFGVDRTLVSRIKHGKAWAETTGHKKIPYKPRTRAQLDRNNELLRAREKAKRASRRQAALAEAILSA